MVTSLLAWRFSSSALEQHLGPILWGAKQVEQRGEGGSLMLRVPWMA